MTWTLPKENKPRPGKPYIWVTWITPLLAGKNRCVWAPWIMARYQVVKVPDRNSGSLAKWRREHDEMVRSRAGLLREDGWNVGIEESNSFKVEGKTATLSGKPDLVAGKGDVFRVIDQKSGEAKDEHPWQIRIYMWALGLLSKADAVIQGELQYREHVENVTLEPPQTTAIVEMMQTMGSDTEPPRTPSPGECSNCKIADCPDRAATIARSTVKADGLF